MDQLGDFVKAKLVGKRTRAIIGKKEMEFYFSETGISMRMIGGEKIELPYETLVSEIKGE